MLLPPLIKGTLIRRYKRFLVDVKLKNGHIVTAHCPNTGSMLGCCEPGQLVYLSRHNSSTRRLTYTFELIEMPASLVGVNTAVPNRLVREAILGEKIAALAGYHTVRSEVRYGNRSRIDLLLEGYRDTQCYIELKNCSLVEDGVACFPDAVTARGLKHLLELKHEVLRGNRCVIFYVVQRTDASLFKPADHIDPAYGRALRDAVRCGVEIMVYDVTIDTKKIELHKPLPHELSCAC